MEQAISADIPIDTEGLPGEPEVDETPMGVARRLVGATRRKRELEAQLLEVKAEIERLSPRVLCLIADELLPHSFSLAGGSVFTREDIWASPMNGDHKALTRQLQAHGLVEYLPSKVNSQSISAYVREHYDKETGEIDLPEDLLAALKVSAVPKVVVNFG